MNHFNYMYKPKPYTQFTVPQKYSPKNTEFSYKPVPLDAHTPATESFRQASITYPAHIKKEIPQTFQDASPGFGIEGILLTSAIIALSILQKRE